MPFTGISADYFISKRILSVTNVRRIYNVGGFIAQCVFMMMAAYILNETAIIVCLTLGVGLGAFSLSGFAVNHLDIAPQFASILMGITNTFATIPGIVSPLLTGVIVTSDDQETMKSEWRIVFFISASIYLVGAVVYWIFCSGEAQPWAIVKTTDIDDEEGNGKEKHAYSNKALEINEKGDF